MPELDAVYDSEEAIPEQFKELFTPVGDKFMLTNVNGIKTDADVQRVQRALDQERTTLKEMRTKLEPWGDLSPDEVHAKLDKYPELEAAADGKIDEEKMEELVTARVNSKVSPLERENNKLKTDLAERDTTIEGYEARERQRTIHEQVRTAAEKAKVYPEAIEDVLLLSDRVFEIDADNNVVTKENSGVLPGIGAEVWLQEMQEKRPHWWPASAGGGAGGSKDTAGFANNPYSDDHWNLTEQGRVIREKGRPIADQMAKAAGTTVGGPRPRPADKN